MVGLSDAELLAAVTDHEVEQRRLVAYRHALIAEVETRGLARERGMRIDRGVVVAAVADHARVRPRRGCRRRRTWVRGAG